MKTHIHGRFYPLSDLELELYLVGDAPAALCARVEDAMQHNDALHAYLTQREQARVEFVRRFALKRRRPRGSISWAAGLAVASALSLMLWVQHTSPTPMHSAEHAVRVKGDALPAVLYVKRGDNVFKLRPEHLLRQGDGLRLELMHATPGYLSVLGRDASGHVATYYENLPTEAGRYTVPDSLVLDAQAQAMDEDWLVILAHEPRPASAYVPLLTGADTPFPAPAHKLFHLRREATQ